MRIRFHLNRADVKETGIYARFFVNGKDIKIYLKETIEPKLWNTKTQRAVQSSRFIGYSEFNSRLGNIEQKINEVHRRLVNDSDTNKVSLKLLKDKVGEELYPDRGKNNHTTLMGLIACIIDESEKGRRHNRKTGNCVSEATIKSYRTTYQHLIDFQAKGNAVEFADVNMEFYNEFKKYLIEECNLMNNSFGKHIKILKMVMNEGLERDYHKHTAHKSRNFAVIHEKSNPIYLTKDELNLFSALDLSKMPTYEHVRDLFLIATYTALRQSDASRLSSENFKEDGYIHIRQQKTNEEIAIPIKEEVTKIYDKYGGNMPPAISDQKTNKYLKEIGKMIEEFHAPVMLNYMKGGKNVTKTVKKYELLCTHTARRSFCTNEYLKGTPIQFIMSVTGHQSENAFMRYIRLSQKDKAKMLKLSWDSSADLHVA